MIQYIICQKVICCNIKIWLYYLEYHTSFYSVLCLSYRNCLTLFTTRRFWLKTATSLCLWKTWSRQAIVSFQRTFENCLNGIFCKLDDFLMPFLSCTSAAQLLNVKYFVLHWQNFLNANMKLLNTVLYTVGGIRNWGTLIRYWFS